MALYDGYERVPEDELKPGDEQRMEATEFLAKLPLEYGDDLPFEEGVNHVATMIENSRRTLINAPEGSRFASDIDVGDKAIALLSYKKGKDIERTLHFLKLNAANVLIESFMREYGRN